jgi:hypothetical protein
MMNAFGGGRMPVRTVGHRRAIVLVLPLFAGCHAEPKSPPLFTFLTPQQTGVTFANTIATTDSVNIQTDLYIYNGAGVAVGDVNNDGLPDLFFSGNQVSSRLYLNRGDMRFEDVTQRAGVATSRWATGASMADVNDDGYLDIYVSVSGPEWSTGKQRANLLFLNNGDATFREAAAQFGVADTGFTAHAAFLDYDRDGDLDLFLLENSPQDFARGEAERHPAGVPSTSTASYDELYRNNGNGTFTNASRQAGILEDMGYGLGVVVTDFNRDGWPDIYISNDDTPNDVLYVNNRDGTFTDKAATWLKHTGLAGMGTDAADFNNDGWPDIAQNDMMPPSINERKRMSGFMIYSDVLELRQRGFRIAYDVNSLQLSSGVLSDGNVVFSEIARMAGTVYTDWSWSVLFADFDNDGFKDLFVANGYPKAVLDFDYQTAMHRVDMRMARERMGAAREQDRQRGQELLRALPAYEAANYLFRNAGGLTFTDESKAWGMDRPSLSYGAAYADLNNDGRLDLVVNNIDAPAFIYQGIRPENDSSHYLQVELAGESPNRHGIGAQLILSAGGQRQYLYHNPYRGYASTMDDREHFGVGQAARVDTLEVIWPDGRVQVLTGLDPDRLVTVRQSDASHMEEAAADDHGPARTRSSALDWARPRSSAMFQPAGAGTALRYRHQANRLVDFNVQPLLPYMLSRQGPPIAVGDVTGDGLDDVFLGGGAGVPGKLFVQRPGGGWVESAQGQPWAADRGHDDWGALFFDANGDGLLDLYLAGGGYFVSPVSRWLQDRLYLNQGGGRFLRDSLALPEMLTSTAAVAAGDFNGDGSVDLFVGGRLVPGNYPYPTRSYLLRNDGGRFTDVTAEVAPELAQPYGMITAAVWVDFDGDGRLDLVTAGEWMPLAFYHNDGAGFRNVTASRGLPPMRGWWYSLAAGDFNQDGRPDLVAGNLGLNYTFQTSAAGKFGVYAGDFEGNQSTDIMFTQEMDGTEYPYWGLARLGREVYTIALRFPTYQSFSTVSVPQLLSPSQVQQAVHYQADTFASVYLQNRGDGTYSSSRLPTLAQISPIRGILAQDVDQDGHLDLIVAGNIYEAEPNTPRADAGNGLWLRGDGQGHFTPVPTVESGFLAPRDVTGLVLVHTPRGREVLVANCGDSLQAFSIQPRKQTGAPVR